MIKFTSVRSEKSGGDESVFLKKLKYRIKEASNISLEKVGFFHINLQKKIPLHYNLLPTVIGSLDSPKKFRCSTKNISNR